MNPKKLRKYGDRPFNVAMLHGGPGAPGQMKPVAEELSSGRGLLEPFQTEYSIEDQVDELRDVLEEHGDFPVTLIGYSWGAWLGIIFSAIYPPLVRKVILVGSPPFREKYAAQIMETRLRRLGHEERKELQNLVNILEGSEGEVQREPLIRFEELSRRADTYEPIPEVNSGKVEFQPEIFRRIWEEAKEVRESGELLELAQLIECPVVAIHGDYDPHPDEGVREPLAREVEDFRFVLLKKCGHTPWLERHAKDKFFTILGGLIG